MYQEIDAYLLRLIQESSPARTAWNVESIRQGKPASWNYIDGCMLTALLALRDITGDTRYSDFVEGFVDSFIGEDGSIRGYEPEKHSLDDINEGRVLFPLYRATGREKYRLAARYLRERLAEQPRTEEGNFWHKAIYPNQVWLDGLYMAQVFYALYERELGTGDYTDTVSQIETVRKRMYDPEKRLYYHGYDPSRKAFWASRETGCSAGFWLRSIGWFAVALADLMEIIPAERGGDRLAEIFRELMEGVSAYADPDTGMFWQVGGSRRPGGQLPGDQRQQHALLRHAQGRAPGGSGKGICRERRKDLPRHSKPLSLLPGRGDAAGRHLPGGGTGTGEQPPPGRLLCILHLGAGGGKRRQGRGALRALLYGDQETSSPSLIFMLSESPARGALPW